MRRFGQGLMAAIFVLGVLSAQLEAHAQTAPQISSVDHASMPVGGRQCVNGVGFGDSQGTSTITLNGTAMNVFPWVDYQICFTVPASTPPGAASVQVTTAAGSSNVVNFTLTPPPTISSISPTTGAVGAQVTLVGANFGATQGNSSVSIGPAGTINSWSDTQIVFTVPQGAYLGKQTVWLFVDSVAATANFTVTAQASPTISTIAPASGPTGTQVTITGSGFGSTQGANTVTFNGVAATVASWADTNISAVVPQGATSGDVVVSVSGQQTNGAAFTVLINPILSGRFTQTVTAVTLTSPLALDWEHWGTTDDQPLVRMAGSQFLLSDLSVIGSNSPQLFSDGEIEYLWSDGDVLTAAERTTTGVSISGTGNGFHLTVQADTKPKTLVLYVGASSAQGQLTASLSDNSSAAYVDSSLNAALGNDLSGTYTIYFRAGQPGETLNIDYIVLIDNGNGTNLTGAVTLESAALFPHLPVVALTAPADGQVLSYPADVAIAGTVSQIDTSIAKLDLFSDSQNVFELLTAPYTFTLSGLAAGDHVLTGTATDSSSLAATSDPVLVTEVQAGGSLSALIEDPVNVDLSSGTSDWVHWGNPGSVSNIDRKAGTAPQISDLITLANGDVFTSDDTGRSVNYSWSGGTPTDSQLGTGTQVFMQGYKNGFTLTIPADRTVRTAKLYLGYGFGTSKLRASLSDGSATPWVNTFSTSAFYEEKVITFQFQAASAGQSLIISDQVVNDGGFAYVDLESATVSDQNQPAISAISPNTGGPGTTLTISGSNFGDGPAGRVTLSGSLLTVNSWSNSSITATLTGGYGSGPVVVSQGLANSN